MPDRLVARLSERQGVTCFPPALEHRTRIRQHPIRVARAELAPASDAAGYLLNQHIPNPR